MSNKKPSELAVWNKDKTMVVHAHKPGVSQKISIQDIVDAVPVPEMPELPEPLEVSEKGKELVALETVQAMKQMLEVPEASEAGKELVALETVAAMKEMLEVPDSEGDQITLQEHFRDTTPGRALAVGAFGLGNVGSNPYTGKEFQGHLRIKTHPTGFFHVLGSSTTGADGFSVSNGGINLSSERLSLINMNSGYLDVGFQLAVINKSNKSGKLFYRRSVGTRESDWEDWVGLGNFSTALWDQEGSVITARVLDASRGTKDANGFYTSMTGRTGLQPVAFDGSDMPSLTPYINGTWAQISYCDHDSEDPVKKIALWRRIK